MDDQDPRIEADMTGSIGWRRMAALGLGILAALGLIILISMVSLSNRQRDVALAAQRHSFEVMILARTLESTMTRSEAALGRYVISGDQQVGRYYYEQWRRAGQLIDRLDEVTRDNAEHTALIGMLRQIYRTRGDQLSETALRTNYGQGWNALSKYYQAGQSRSLAQLASTLDRIIANETKVLNERTSVAAMSVERSNRLARVLAVFGIVVILGALVLGWSMLQALAQQALARRDIAQASRRAAELEEAVRDRTVALVEANEKLRTEGIERAHAEAQLRQVQKMEAVGQLTGGIAHDFNNMLAVVVGGLELARRRIVDGGGDALRHVDNAMDGAKRAAALTRRLLAFARSEPLLPAAVAPGELIRGMSDLLDRTLGERIKVETICEDEGWRIWVDRHQLENALLNLAVNARDAMDGEGTLVIRTGRRTLKPGEIDGAEAGDYATIAVTDNGCGMTPEVLERVFEPFFTTKPVGKGTGLGLSQIFGFVRQSRGEIEIGSTPGEGTTVTILLPRHDADEAGDAGSALADAQPAEPSGAHRILVVEDDPRVLVSTTEALSELGYLPLPCPDPALAAGMMAANPDIALIVTDVVMPGLTGPELVAQLHDAHPDVGVLFVTGYAGEVEDKAFGGHAVLRKPFTMGRLTRAIEAALAQARVSAAAE